MVDWNDHVNIKRIRNNDFCLELQIESNDAKENFWPVFVHVSTNANER